MAQRVKRGGTDPIDRIDDVFNDALMRFWIRKGAKSKRRSPFAFKQRCKKLKGMPLLIIGPPGKKIKGSLIRALKHGSKTIRGWMYRKAQYVIFEVKAISDADKRKMKRLICAISTRYKARIPKKYILILTPEEIAQQHQESLGHNESLDDAIDSDVSPEDLMGDVDEESAPELAEVQQLIEQVSDEADEWDADLSTSHDYEAIEKWQTLTTKLRRNNSSSEQVTSIQKLAEVSTIKSWSAKSRKTWDTKQQKVEANQQHLENLQHSHEQYVEKHTERQTKQQYRQKKRQSCASQLHQVIQQHNERTEQEQNLQQRLNRSNQLDHVLTHLHKASHLIPQSVMTESTRVTDARQALLFVEQSLENNQQQRNEELQLQKNRYSQAIEQEAKAYKKFVFTKKKMLTSRLQQARTKSDIHKDQSIASMISFRQNIKPFIKELDNIQTTDEAFHAKRLQIRESNLKKQWQKSEERLQKFLASKTRQRNLSWQIDYENDVEELEDRFQELHNDTTRMLSAMESGSNIFFSKVAEIRANRRFLMQFMTDFVEQYPDAADLPLLKRLDDALSYADEQIEEGFKKFEETQHEIEQNEDELAFQEELEEIIDTMLIERSLANPDDTIHDTDPIDDLRLVNLRLHDEIEEIITNNPAIRPLICELIRRIHDLESFIKTSALTLDVAAQYDRDGAIGRLWELMPHSDQTGAFKMELTRWKTVEAYYWWKLGRPLETKVR